MKTIILKGLKNFSDGTDINPFKIISKRDQLVYNDLFDELSKSVKKLAKSFNKKSQTKSKNDFTTEDKRLIRFKNAFKNLLKFEIDHFTVEHLVKYKKENWNLNLWDALVCYPYDNYQLFFSSELFWLWEDYNHEFKTISGMLSKDYLEIE